MTASVASRRIAWVGVVASFSVGLLLAAVIGVAGSDESLWVDELHSSWVIAGDAADISSRAAAGNQSPAYFWILFAIRQLVGGTLGGDLTGNFSHGELWLRSVSWLAWGLALGLGASYAWRSSSQQQLSLRESGGSDRRGLLSAVGVAGALLLLAAIDRLQWFYATEARPYALLQLVNLLGWVVVASSVARADGARTREQAWWLAAWVVLAIAAIHLHLTAVLPVACQWLGLMLGGMPPRLGFAGWWCVRRGRWLAVGGLAAMAVVGGAIPLRWMAWGVWQRRGQWASFAGDASLANSWRVLPWAELLLAVPVAWLVVAIFRGWPWGKQTLQSKYLGARVQNSVQVRSRLVRTVWLWGGVGPWLIAWMLTGLGWAPLMHSRYVLVSAMPMLVWGVLSLGRLRGVLIMLLAVGWLAYGTLSRQGTLGVWQRGELIGEQRGENWRGACRWLQERIEGGDELWCASGLIEGRVRADEMTTELHEYLGYPLRGMYSMDEVGGGSDWGQSSYSGSEPQALVADWREWPQQWREADARGATGTRWIIYRGRAGRLESILGRLGVEVVAPPVAFGKVSVAGVGSDGSD